MTRPTALVVEVPEAQALYDAWLDEWEAPRGVPVYAPALAKQIEEEPDERYGDGDTLPGGLRAYFTPGAGTTQHTLLHDATGAAFVPDLLLKGEGRELEVCPAEYAYDPKEQRRSLEKILELPFSVLCLAHGPAITDDPKGATRAALEAYARA